MFISEKHKSEKRGVIKITKKDKRRKLMLAIGDDGDGRYFRDEQRKNIGR